MADVILSFTDHRTETTIFLTEDGPVHKCQVIEGDKYESKDFRDYGNAFDATAAQIRKRLKVGPDGK